MEQVDLVVHSKWLITCEEGMPVLRNHALIVRDNKILAYVPSEIAKTTYQAKETQYLTEHAILPGFINAHTHLAMNLFRGLADDLNLMDWLNNYIWPAERQWVSREFVYDGSLLAMAEMIRGGTTCFNDMYFFPEATAEAALLSGMRAGIGMTIINVPTAWAKTPEEYLKKSLAFYEAYHQYERIIPTFAPHSTYTVSADELLKVHELAKQLGVKTNIHLQEDSGEMTFSHEKFQKRPLQRLYEMGIVSKDLIAIHMTQLDDKDFDIIQETKLSIVHCPESNFKIVSGCCPIEKLWMVGANVALGTDGAASNNDLSMLGEMRSAALIGKMTANNASAVSADKVLRMATINGAKALGIDQITGTLTPGKAADFIAIHLETIETVPVYQPISQIVYAADRSQVTDVWVSGKQLLKSRQLTTLDEKELLQKAHHWQKKIGADPLQV